MARVLHTLSNEVPEAQTAKFLHDFEQLKKWTLVNWVNNWLSDLIRANNQTPNTRIISVGIGKTTRLFRLRSDFQLLDYTVKPKIIKAYRNAKNRVIILDNKVILYIYPFRVL